MPLKDAEIRAFRAMNKPVNKAYGAGLYLGVFPTGSKLWRLKLRIGGKEKRLALGSYPAVSLADARKCRDAARAQIEQVVDPPLGWKREKAAAKFNAENSFEQVVNECLAVMESEGLTPHEFICNCRTNAAHRFTSSSHHHQILGPNI